MPQQRKRHDAANSHRTNRHLMKAVEVTVADGAETIRVAPSRRGITLTNGSRWSQTLTREEAWRLAEAIGAVATGAPGRD